MNLLDFTKNVFFPVLKVQAASWKPTDGVDGDANDLIQKVLNLLLTIVVVAAVVYMMLAGIQYVTSQGDAQKAKTAMASITNAIIGLIVAFAAYALISMIKVKITGQEIQSIEPEPVTQLVSEVKRAV